MENVEAFIGHIPAVIYGAPSERAYLFVHGKHGCKEEAEAFSETICPKGWQVISVDMPGSGSRQAEGDVFDPWHTVPELTQVMAWARAQWGRIALRATSLGAWFSMLAFAAAPPERALFVSPVLDMARLIENVMTWAGVTAEELEARQTIPTDFGETLSWRYYQYAREHPISRWEVPTAILYAGQDHLTERAVAEAFTARFHCHLTVMEDGEHWFHTPEQLAVQKRWEEGQAL